MNNLHKTIVIASGGTGGHLYPAIQVGNELKNFGYKTIFAVDDRVKSLIDDKITICSGSPFKSGFLNKIFNITQLVLGFLQSVYFLYKNKVCLVIGFGGYSSVPVVVASGFLRIPIILHEQNAVLGRANRFCLYFTDIIALSFKKTAKISKNIKTTYTGNPVRSNISKIGNKKYSLPRLSSFNIFIIGGSQGAKIFSKNYSRSNQLSSQKDKREITCFSTGKIRRNSWSNKIL